MNGSFKLELGSLWQLGAWELGSLELTGAWNLELGSLELGAWELGSLGAWSLLPMEEEVFVWILVLGSAQFGARQALGTVPPA